MNLIVAGAFQLMVGAPAGVFAPCEHCRCRESTHAVGTQDHKLVCEPCLSHGDRRRLWNLEPRQVL